MKLSMSMIEGYLSRYDTESSIQGDERIIHGMRFLSGGSDWSREYVYIGQAGDYLKNPIYDDALILTNGMSHIVCRGSDYEELLNDVLSAFDFYNGVDQRLMKAATMAMPLDDMVAVIDEALREPFLVFGLDGAFLAGSRVDDLPSEPLRESIRQSGSLGSHVISGRFTDKSGAVQHDLTEHARATYDGSGEFAVNRYLTQNGEIIGFVMCFPHDESAIQFAVDIEEAFAPYLAQAHEFTDALSPFQSQHMALGELIEGRQVAAETIERLVGSVGRAQRYCLACVKSLAIRNRTQRLMLAREVERSSASCISCEAGEDVVFLVAEGGVDALVEQIRLHFDAQRAAIGVSMPMADIRQASVAYRQALFACDAKEEPGLRYCRDLALPFLLKVLQSEPAVADLAHPALATLASYDANAGAELYGTLAAYVASGCNQSDCARLLHVHLNTLKYRLKRISELTGVDFKDQGELYYLWLSFAIQDYASIG